MTTSTTNLSLIERARTHDQQAWSELVDLYSPLVIAWCRRLHISHESTADCIQDVFSSVARALDTYHPPGSTGAFRGWLWTITRNKLRDAARRERRHAVPPGGSTALGQIKQIVDNAELPTEEPTSSLEQHALLHRALEQIQPSFAASTWQAFWRTVVDGQSTHSVAQELQVTPAVVRQSRSRILRRLRQQMCDQ